MLYTISTIILLATTSSSGSTLKECEYLAEPDCISAAHCVFDGEECVTLESDCESKLQPDCSAPCVWNPAEVECVDGELYEAEQNCENFAQADCASPCVWSDAEYECVDPEYEEAGCESNSQPDCSSPCVWSMDEMECVDTELEIDPEDATGVDASDAVEDAAEAAADPEEGVEPSDVAEDQAELAADPEEAAEAGDTGLEDASMYSSNCAKFTDQAQCNGAYHCIWTTTCLSTGEIDLQQPHIGHTHSVWSVLMLIFVSFFGGIVGYTITFLHKEFTRKGTNEDILLENRIV